MFPRSESSGTLIVNACEYARLPWLFLKIYCIVSAIILEKTGHNLSSICVVLSRDFDLSFARCVCLSLFLCFGLCVSLSFLPRFLYMLFVFFVFLFCESLNAATLFEFVHIGVLRSNGWKCGAFLSNKRWKNMLQRAIKPCAVFVFRMSSCSLQHGVYERFSSLFFAVSN